MRDVGGLHLEGAEIGPEIDGVGDTGTAALVDHLRRLRAGDVELEIRILLPVPEEQGELKKKAIIGVA